MIVFLDTNVVIDSITGRDNFSEDSTNAILKALEEADDVYMACSSVIDIMYILRKELKNGEISRDAINNFLTSISVADVYADFVKQAFSSSIPDFEDAVIEKTAISVDADFIITRNKIDFVNSKIPAITPNEFIELKNKE